MSPLYAYYKNYCVCPAGIVYIGMHAINGDETSSYGVDVYNVNGVMIGTVANKANYITMWNADAANQAIGTLSGAPGPFSFALTLKAGQVPPPWVFGNPNGVVSGIFVVPFVIEFV